MAEDGSIGFPAPDPLPNDYKDVPDFFVVDDAFGLRKNMMKPYTLRGLTENAFGILANSFQILLTTMQHHPSTVKITVKACIVLHNVMRMRYPTLQNQQLDRAENVNIDFIPGAWRQGKTYRTSMSWPSMCHNKTGCCRGEM